MPDYEYVCLSCKKRFTLFFRYEDYGKHTIACPHCESDIVRRKIGRVRVAHAPSARLEDMSDPQNLDALEDDPRALGRMMRQMSEETGEAMGPEFDEVVNRLEKGQNPEDIEQDMPDLMNADSSPAGSDAYDDDF